MSVLVTGANGRLGRVLRPLWPEARFVSRAEANVASRRALEALLDAIQPSLIVHLAAETRYDASPRDLLYTNVLGTANIVLWAIGRGVRLVFTSTVYVYPCTHGPYTEEDALAPVGPYAWSKLAGEAAIRQVPNHLIVRGCWYEDLPWARAATDAYSTRMPAADAARQLKQLAQLDVRGVVNIGAPRRSLYNIVRDLHPQVEPCSANELTGLPYAFPREACVDASKARALGVA